MQSLKQDITSSFENAAVSKVLDLDKLVTYMTKFYLT